MYAVSALSLVVLLVVSVSLAVCGCSALSSGATGGAWSGDDDISNRGARAPVVMFRADDGWARTYDLYTLLKSYGIPLAIGVGPGHVGGGVGATKQLTYDQLREMYAGGATIAFHGAHQAFPGSHYGWLLSLWGSLDAWQAQFDADYTALLSNLAIPGFAPDCCFYPSCAVDAECVPHLKAMGFKWGQSAIDGSLGCQWNRPVWTSADAAVWQADASSGSFRIRLHQPTFLTLDGPYCTTVDEAVARAQFVGRNGLVISNMAHMEPPPSQKPWNLDAVKAYVETLQSYGTRFMSMADFSAYVMDPSSPHMTQVGSQLYPNSWNDSPLMDKGVPFECVPARSTWLPTKGWTGSPAVRGVSDGSAGVTAMMTPEGPFDLPAGRFYRFQVYAYNEGATSAYKVSVASRDEVTGAYTHNGVVSTTRGKWQRVVLWIGPGPAGTIVPERGVLWTYLWALGPAGSTTLFSKPSIKPCPVGAKAGDRFEYDIIGLNAPLPAGNN